MKLVSLIMAGGLGKRMKSSLPKVCHKYNDDSMINHIIARCRGIDVDEIWIVMGQYRDIIYQHITDKNIKEISQPIALGTGDAVKCAIPNLLQLKDNDNIIILPGDAPLITENTLQRLYDKHLSNGCVCTLLTCQVQNPFGYGRIIFNNNRVESIIEENEANEQEKLIDIINGGIYIFRIKELLFYLPKITNNNSKNEYYLTDIIKMYTKDGLYVDMYMTEKSEEISNVNSMEELNRINSSVKIEIIKR